MSTSKEEQIEAIESLLNSKESLAEVVDGLFEQNDTDNTGYIEKEEFVKIVNDLSESMQIPEPSESEVDEVIESLDQNNDGKFNKNEFTSFIELLLKALLESLKK